MLQARIDWTGKKDDIRHETVLKKKDIGVYSLDLINSLDEFFLLDKNRLVASKEVLDENIIDEVEKIVYEELGERDYAKIADLDIFYSFKNKC